ncbi:MAG: hypothetical protein FWG87_04830 [Defluviitaleaceae bacterium]|nr:hypothetical protein [Defluviitaleaceae bacterium]
MDFREFYNEPIRVIRENPLNPRTINHLLHHWLKEFARFRRGRIYPPRGWHAPN